jgi:hypothetical protein
MAFAGEIATAGIQKYLSKSLANFSRECAD